MGRLAKGANRWAQPRFPTSFLRPPPPNAKDMGNPPFHPVSKASASGAEFCRSAVAAACLGARPGVYSSFQTPCLAARPTAIATASVVAALVSLLRT